MKNIFVAYLLLTINLSHAQDRHAIIIDEIMADPAPIVGLPPNEWIELKNISTRAINLQNWRFCDENSQSGPFPFFILQPDSLVILCTPASSLSMQQYGQVIPVTSFPSLDNDGDLLFLKNNNGMIIHAVEYSKSWYNNAVKSDGGWTLEMIDTHFPCVGGQNWRSSSDLSGGTPGRKNAVNNTYTDSSPPILERSFLIDSNTIILLFNEPLDSSSASAIQNYNINNGITINRATPISPLFKQVRLVINQPLQQNIIYELSVKNVTDCMNNAIGISNKCRVAIPQTAEPKDVVINEILFDPRSGDGDFLEIYNRGEKVIDIKTFYIATRALNGSLNAPQQVITSPFYLYPRDHLVITEDQVALFLNYFVKYPEKVITQSSLPSFPNEEGNVILLNSQGVIVDEVNYKDDWHFSLITDTEGISLERIDPDGASNDRHNWHSAASSAGNATPGYKNSQYRVSDRQSSIIAIDPAFISPDNDGRDDFITIHYKITEPGFVGNFYIYDINGIMKNHLLKNALLGMNGSFKWDGLGENKNILSGGVYILVTEIFNLSGKIQKFKNVIVLVKKVL